MAEPIYLGLVFIICLIAVYFLRLKCLYLLFIDAFVQNTALPFMYTSLGASRELVASLLVSKEVLLVILFAWCLYVWESKVRRPWPKPVVILFLFTCYCTVRIGFAFAGGDDPSQCFRKLRLASLPLLFLTVAITTAYTQPEFARKFLRQMTYLLCVLSFVGVLMWLLPPSDFWVKHANMTTYGIDIRGDEPYEYEEDTGVRHTAAGREAFSILAPFRAFGTFGDPLAMGFGLSSPFLLLTFVYGHKKWVTGVLLGILAAGLFATFDRSAWIFVFVASLFILFRRRKYKWLLAIALVPIVSLLTVPPLAEFAKYETEDLSWNHPGSSTHAEGIVWLYKSGFTDPENILGSGMGEDPHVNHESGYGWLLEHFGLAAYLLWMWFLVAMYRHSKLPDSSQRQIPLLSQAMIVGTFVVMHFSYYPFSFIGWIPIWYLFGLSVAGASTAMSRLRIPQRSLADQRQRLLPESGHA
jgi:hypothetical protein